ncbi:MAG: hypothetical protein ACTTKA_03400 [Tannerella sp.]
MTKNMQEGTGSKSLALSFYPAGVELTPIKNICSLCLSPMPAQLAKELKLR